MAELGDIGDPGSRRRGRVSKTSLEIDRDIAAQAAVILGTATLRDTIDAALHEIVNARRRLELVALLSEPGRFAFDAVERASAVPHGTAD